MSVAASACGTSTTPASISKAPPPRLTNSSTGIEIHIWDRAAVVTSGIAQAL